MGGVAELGAVSGKGEGGSDDVAGSADQTAVHAVEELMGRPKASFRGCRHFGIKQSQSGFAQSFVRIGKSLEITASVLLTGVYFCRPLVRPEAHPAAGR